MIFKELEWKDEGRYATTRAPFGLELRVRGGGKENLFLWEFGNAYNALKKGRATTFNGAKKNATKAYHKYIEENVENC